LPSKSTRASAASRTTEKFLARLGTAFPGTVWVGGCKNWYTSQQPTPVLWPFPQSEHKAFFEQVPAEDFEIEHGSSPAPEWYVVGSIAWPATGKALTSRSQSV
jgi:hypothetical protein